MKAATRRRYGPPEVLRIEEAAIPEPRAGEVRIRVHATSVTSGDVRLRGFREMGIFWLPGRLILGMLRPRDPRTGMEFSGRIEALGAGVTGWRLGDAAFGMVAAGANAECLVLPATGIAARRPEALSDAEAAALPFGALTALCFLRDIARVQPGERVLVHGAAGNVGVFAVQLARHFGAEVTAVCSAPNMALVRSLGATQVIDRGAADFTQGADAYDVVLDTVGTTRFRDVRRVLAPRGRHVFVSFQLPQLLQVLWTRWSGGQRVLCGYSPGSQADLRLIAALAESGTLRPVIEREYALDEVAAAHAHVDSGHKRGSVILTPPGAAPSRNAPRSSRAAPPR